MPDPLDHAAILRRSLSGLAFNREMIRASIHRERCTDEEIDYFASRDFRRDCEAHLPALLDELKRLRAEKAASHA